jgi:cytochrome P450
MNATQRPKHALGPQGEFSPYTQFVQSPLRFLERAAREYGDIVETRFFSSPVFILNHPDHIQEIIEKNSQRVVKSSGLKTPEMSRLAGRGLLTSEGNLWRERRKLAQPAFHADHIRRYSEVMVRRSREAIAEWKRNGAIALHREMQRLTMSTAVECLFGIRDFTEPDLVSEALDDLQSHQPHPSAIGRIAASLPSARRIRFNGAARRLDNVVLDLVERGRTRRSRDSLLSLIQHASNTGALSTQGLRDEAVTFLLAGHETTALTLFWSFYLLAQHPAAAARLRQEIKSILGTRTPGAQDLSQLRFTNAVIKEAMRLYPPAWSIGRMAKSEIKVGGVTIPAGAEILMSQWVVHRDARFYRDPEQFRPERWSSDETKNLPKYAYFPFGGGPFGCIGGGFAMTEACLLLTTVWQSCALTMAQREVIVPKATVTLRPSSELKMNCR